MARGVQEWRSRAVLYGKYRQLPSWCRMICCQQLSMRVPIQHRAFARCSCTREMVLPGTHSAVHLWCILYRHQVWAQQ